MKAQPFIVYLPDTRGVEISRYGMGNSKIGFGVFTYSRPAGNPDYRDPKTPSSVMNPGGTCPGSTPECEAICYAKRIEGVVRLVYFRNRDADVPPIPADCQVLRIHVSGDFDTPTYIKNWVMRLTERPDVTCWAYTRSWRVPALLPDLEVLRALPNMQLFASMDQSTPDLPPAGWRRAWIDGDRRAQWDETPEATDRNMITVDGIPSFVCPEETGHKKNCLECGYCFEGKRNDVTFLRH